MFVDEKKRHFVGYLTRSTYIILHRGVDKRFYAFVVAILELYNPEKQAEGHYLFLVLPSFATCLSGMS